AVEQHRAAQRLAASPRGHGECRERKGLLDVELPLELALMLLEFPVALSQLQIGLLELALALAQTLAQLPHDPTREGGHPPRRHCHAETHGDPVAALYGREAGVELGEQRLHVHPSARGLGQHAPHDGRMYAARHLAVPRSWPDRAITLAH